MRVYTLRKVIVEGTFRSRDSGLDSKHQKEAKRQNEHAHEETVKFFQTSKYLFRESELCLKKDLLSFCEKERYRKS